MSDHRLILAEMEALIERTLQQLLKTEQLMDGFSQAHAPGRDSTSCPDAARPQRSPKKSAPEA